MTPIPIGNPETARRLTNRYDLKGKVGLNHDEVVVPVSLLEDVRPAPQPIRARISGSATAGTIGTVSGAAPVAGRRWILRSFAVTCALASAPSATSIAAANLFLDLGGGAVFPIVGAMSLHPGESLIDVVGSVGGEVIIESTDTGIALSIDARQASVAVDALGLFFGIEIDDDEAWIS